MLTLIRQPVCRAAAGGLHAPTDWMSQLWTKWSWVKKFSSLSTAAAGKAPLSGFPRAPVVQKSAITTSRLAASPPQQSPTLFGLTRLFSAFPYRNTQSDPSIGRSGRKPRTYAWSLGAIGCLAFLPVLYAEPKFSTDGEKTLGPLIGTEGEGKLLAASSASQLITPAPPSWLSLLSPLQLLHLVYRVTYLGALFVPVLLSFPVWWYFNRGRMENDKDPLRTWWIRYLVWSLERAGGLFIKLGQWLSSRVDVIPPRICEVLAKLQTNVKPHSVAHSRKAVEALFGKKIDDIFVEFDDEPVGTGAVAQVHRAVLRLYDAEGPMNEVAIKILHPNIRRRMNTDLILVKMTGFFLNLIPGAKYLNFNEEIALFSRMMQNQLDMEIEANNLRVFAKNFEKVSVVQFPAPIKWNQDVLVETYHNGLLLREVLSNAPTPYDDALAQIGVHTFMQMILRDNFFHCDLHPGNALISFIHTPEAPSYAQKAGAFITRTWDQSKSSKAQSIFHAKEIDVEALDNLRRAPRSATIHILNRMKAEGWVPKIVILDAGIVGSLSEENMGNVKDAFTAGLDFDGTKIADLFLTRCKDPQNIHDPALARETLKQLLDDLKLDTGGTLPLSRVQSAEVVTRVANMLRHHRIALDGEFVNLFLCATLAEGVARKLDADMNLLDPLAEYLL